jgi:hypothetical protein
VDRFHPEIDRAVPSPARLQAARRWLYLSVRDSLFAAASWPHCTLILVAAEVRRPSRAFNPRSNRIGWDGPRASGQPACGGGRRVIRKHVPFN